MEITLPKWLDALIFDELKAHYQPRCSDMTNIDDDKEKTLNYLGTYFPRSYAEAYCIFSDYFNANKSLYEDKEDLSIFDFGSGTGGEIIGLLTVLDEQCSNLKKVNIVALDGNQHALHLYEKILYELRNRIGFQVENRSSAVMIDDFYDLSILDSVITEEFDIIVSFKAICEFAAKQQFEKQNPYSHIAKFLLPKLRNNGLLLLEDITIKNNEFQEWLPKMMDKGLMEANCKVINRNPDYNQAYYITHSQYENDRSNVAWRMIIK